MTIQVGTIKVRYAVQPEISKFGFALKVLFLCLAGPIACICQEQAQVPAVSEWEGNRIHFEMETAPLLHAAWSIELNELLPSPEVMSSVRTVAVTDKTVVVSFASFCAVPPPPEPPTGDCIILHLASFDRNTGKLRKSIDKKRPDLRSNVPEVFGATSKTF